MDRHRDDTAIRIRNRHAALLAARLAPGQTVQCPAAPFVHLFVARGAVELEGSGRLDRGDAVRMTATGGQQITGIDDAEVLIWEMHAALQLD
jgi:redox-sensitive bicupin YhaK (pirin superfamily)